MKFLLFIMLCATAWGEDTIHLRLRLPPVANPNGGIQPRNDIDAWVEWKKGKPLLHYTRPTLTLPEQIVELPVEQGKQLQQIEALESEMYYKCPRTVPGYSITPLAGGGKRIRLDLYTPEKPGDPPTFAVRVGHIISDIDEGVHLKYVTMKPGQIPEAIGPSTLMNQKVIFYPGRKSEPIAVYVKSFDPVLGTAEIIPQRWLEKPPVDEFYEKVVIRSYKVMAGALVLEVPEDIYQRARNVDPERVTVDNENPPLPLFGRQEIDDLNPFARMRNGTIVVKGSETSPKVRKKIREMCQAAWEAARDK